MPSDQEIREIAEHRAVQESELWKQTQSDSDDRYFQRGDIGKKYPIFKSTGGRISAMPNLTWAIEREIDARVMELFSGRADMTEVERATLSGEMRGLSMAFSMYTGRTVEACSVSALQRYQERNA